MSLSERAERLSKPAGNALLCVAALKWVLELLDRYEQLETVMSLQRYIPFLSWPLLTPLLIVAGISLIEVSHRRQWKLHADKNEGQRIVGPDGTVPLVPPPRRAIWSVLSSLAAGFVIAIFVAIAWLFFHQQPTPPILFKPPAVDALAWVPFRDIASPPRKNLPQRPPMVVTAPSGIAIGGNNYGSATVNNGQVDRELDASSAARLRYLIGTARPASFEGVRCLHNDPESCRYRDKLKGVFEVWGTAPQDIDSAEINRSVCCIVIAISSKDQSSPPAEALHLYRAFKQAGFNDIAFTPFTDLDAGRFYVLVGSNIKPPQ
jgi:hypothetical protein